MSVNQNVSLLRKYLSWNAESWADFWMEQSLLRMWVRVDMVGTNHDEVLTLWRHMPMGQFCANIFLIRLTSTYFWASEVFKNQSFKSQLFSSSLKKNTSNWNLGLILMLLLFFINKIQNLYQFSEKKISKKGKMKINDF